jgi:hypothetical protein
VIASELITKIKNTKGPIYAAISGPNDVIYVQVVKSDLINTFKVYEAETETDFCLNDYDGSIYLENEYRYNIGV